MGWCLKPEQRPGSTGLGDPSASIVQYRFHRRQEESMVEDPRRSRTRQLMYNALVTLLERERLDSITVNDLTKKAGISRTTFYRNYLNRDDFLEKAMNDLLDGIFKRCAVSSDASQKSDTEGYYREFFSYISENKAFFRAFLDYKKWPEFRRKLIDNGIEAYMKIIKKSKKPLRDGLPLQILVNYIVGAHVGVFSYWLANGCTYSAEFMSKQLSRLTIGGPLKLAGLDEESLELPK
jgi:AcrR family transcriptional regulator